MQSINKNTKQNIFKDKVIVLGITGALAAYKICFLIRELKNKGAQVRLVATPSALNFITKTTLQTLAKTPVLTEQFDLKKYDINHKSLQAEADLFILAPASANTISKIACARADNLLTSLLCSWQKPLLIAPAMNAGMWYNPSTQKNIKFLEERGIFITGPQIAQMANGLIGKGPMAEVPTILESAQNILTLQNKLAGKKVLIIGGIVKEVFDKTNFISAGENISKTQNIANIFYLSGAKICLINNDNFEAPYKQIKANTFAEYKTAVLENIKGTDILVIGAKLPAWQITEQKKEGKTLTLTLTPAKDFLAEIMPKTPNNLSVFDLPKNYADKEPFNLIFEILKTIGI